MPNSQVKLRLYDSPKQSPPNRSQSRLVCQVLLFPYLASVTLMRGISDAILTALGGRATWQLSANILLLSSRDYT